MPRKAAEIPAGKRELTKSQNRRAILNAARDVFGELGYETATVRDIIRRTGLAAGTFYNYFRSKEEVFAALADEGARRFQPILKACRAEAPDFESFVRAAIGAWFDFLAGELERRTAQSSTGEPMPHVYGETPEMQAVFLEVRDAIEESLAQGRAPSGDPDYMAAACIAVTREVGDRMLLRRPVDTRAAADFAVAVILDGLRGLPKAG